MRTQLLKEELILKQIEGSLYVEGRCSKGECYLTDRRLIFEESDSRTHQKRIPDEEKFVKDAAVGYLLMGGFGALYGAVKNTESNKGQVIPGSEISAWFEDMTDLNVTDSAVEMTIPKGTSTPELIRFEAAPHAGKFTVSEQEKLRELLKSSKLNTSPEKQSLDLGTKLSLLIEFNAKKGFLRPEQKVEYDISRKMDYGKTREEAIKELYDETMK